MVFEGPDDAETIIKEKNCSLRYLDKGWFGKRLEVKIEGSKEAVLAFAEKHLSHAIITVNKVQEKEK